MESYFVVGVIVLSVIIILAIKLSSSRERRGVLKNKVYSYTVKPLTMSKTEKEFFGKLLQVVEDRYYVFPQVHLSALLDHKVKGQNWSYAFWHINGKSVDYVLCDKNTLFPTYAIELDDFTHERKDRIKRDIEVERIFTDAGLPLVRFKSRDVSPSEIIQALTNAKLTINKK